MVAQFLEVSTPKITGISLLLISLWNYPAHKNSLCHIWSLSLTEMAPTICGVFSLKINPVLTYHLISKFFHNKARTLNSPAAWLQSQAGESAKPQPLLSPLLHLRVTPLLSTITLPLSPCLTLNFHPFLVPYSAGSREKEIHQAFSPI